MSITLDAHYYEAKDILQRALHPRTGMSGGESYVEPAEHKRAIELIARGLRAESEGE